MTLEFTRRHGNQVFRFPLKYFEVNLILSENEAKELAANIMATEWTKTDNYCFTANLYEEDIKDELYNI